jgi:tetrathionate reductase subunit B
MTGHKRIEREIDQDRRGFIKKVLGGAIGGSLLLVIPAGFGMVTRQLGGTREDLATDREGARYAFVVDVSGCIGCGSCCVADKAEYQVPDGNYRTWVERYLIDDQDNVFVD